MEETQKGAFVQIYRKSLDILPSRNGGQTSDLKRQRKGKPNRNLYGFKGQKPIHFGGPKRRFGFKWVKWQKKV
jgi:hypothetical protein